MAWEDLSFVDLSLLSLSSWVDDSAPQALAKASTEPERSSFSLASELIVLRSLELELELELELLLSFDFSELDELLETLELLELALLLRDSLELRLELELEEDEELELEEEDTLLIPVACQDRLRGRLIFGPVHVTSL